MFFSISKLYPSGNDEKGQSLNRQHLSPERSPIDFAVLATIQTTLPYRSGSGSFKHVLLNRQMPMLMKYVYTILFFADTLIFLWLSYLFFRKCDSGSSCSALMLAFSGIVASIFLLVYLLRGYLKLPHDKRRHR
jgi:hypothetical protein